MTGGANLLLVTEHFARPLISVRRGVRFTHDLSLESSHLGQRSDICTSCPVEREAHLLIALVDTANFDLHLGALLLP